jgi:hypothetical protein
MPPIQDVCSPVNAMKRGTPLTGADPTRRGAKHARVYGDRRSDAQRATGMGAAQALTRAAPGDPDPHRAAHLRGECE